MLTKYQKILYNTILSQTISSDGKWAFYGNNFGDIFVQNIKSSSDEKKYYDTFEIGIYSLKGDPVYSLAFYKEYLIVGTVGVISAHKWQSGRLELKPVWELQITDGGYINTMCLDKLTSELYVGCESNHVYQICLSNKKIIRKFIGHNNYIHCVKFQNSQIYSASEDGCVLVWDKNDAKPIKKLKPYKNENLVRTEYGNWLGSVSVYNDWLICGGGPKVSLWHLPTSECTQYFSFPGKVHHCEFIDESIIVAGEHNSIFYYSFNGEQIGNIESNIPSIYSIIYQKQPDKFMSISGASNQILNMTDFRYVDCYVELYKK